MAASNTGAESHGRWLGKQLRTQLENSWGWSQARLKASRDQAGGLTANWVIQGEGQQERANKRESH